MAPPRLDVAPGADALSHATDRSYETADSGTASIGLGASDAGDHDASRSSIVAELTAELFTDVVEVAGAELLDLPRGDEELHARPQIACVAILVSYSASMELEAEHARDIGDRQVERQVRAIGERDDAGHDDRRPLERNGQPTDLGCVGGTMLDR